MIESIATEKNRLIVLISSLIILYTLELAFPFFQGRKGKFKHAVKNLGLGLLNAIIIAIFFTGTILLLSNWAEMKNIGLLHILEIPIWLEIILVIILFDAWMYCWHLINHKFPLFWKFHKMHHTDKDVDVTSAVRFHSGEIILSTIARLGIILLLGLSPWHIVLYEIILLPVILFHHSNINFPEKYDKLYRLIFTSPHMHWIHHSDKRIEADSNYGAIFSFWDRLFKTFKLKNSEKKYKEINQGLKKDINR